MRSAPLLAVTMMLGCSHYEPKLKSYYYQRPPNTWFSRPAPCTFDEVARVEFQEWNYQDVAGHIQMLTESPDVDAVIDFEIERDVARVGKGDSAEYRPFWRGSGIAVIWTDPGCATSVKAREGTQPKSPPGIPLGSLQPRADASEAEAPPTTQPPLSEPPPETEPPPATSAALRDQCTIQGQLDACRLLALKLLEGPERKQKPEYAAQLLTKSCTGNDGIACLELSKLYDSGRGVPREEGKSRELREQACTLGVDDACSPP